MLAYQFFNDAFSASLPNLGYQVQKTESGAVIRVQLPGVAKSRISLSVEKNSVVLKVAKEESKEESKGESSFHDESNYLDYSDGFEFSWRVSPDFDLKSLKAKYDNGLLEIELPKSEQASPRPVTID